MTPAASAVNATDPALDAFARAINAEPSNPMHRLLLADWLEERGDARAEFYRWTAAENKWPTYTVGPNRWLWHDGYDGRYGHASLPLQAFDPQFEQRAWYAIDCKSAFDAFERACAEWMKPQYRHLRSPVGAP